MVPSEIKASLKTACAENSCDTTLSWSYIPSENHYAGRLILIYAMMWVLTYFIAVNMLWMVARDS